MKTTYFVRLFIYFVSSCVVLKNTSSISNRGRKRRMNRLNHFSSTAELDVTENKSLVNKENILIAR